MSHPARTMRVVESASWSVEFSVVARAVASTARALGLDAPGFRSPPSRAGADRTLRRWPDGRCVVAVRVAGRPFHAVVDDLVEGVVAANRLTGDAAGEARTRLRAAALPAGRAA